MTYTQVNYFLFMVKLSKGWRRTIKNNFLHKTHGKEKSKGKKEEGSCEEEKRWFEKEEKKIS